MFLSWLWFNKREWGSPSWLTYIWGIASTWDSVSLTSLSLEEWDILIVCVSEANNVAYASIWITSSWYTEIAALDRYDTLSSNLYVWYKVMWSTPDTTAEVFAENQATSICYAFRGVDTSTPIDVASTTATERNNWEPNPPSITPTTAWSVVIAIGTARTLESHNTTPLTWYNSLLSITWTIGSFNKWDICVCYTDRTSGAEDPPAYSGSTKSQSSRCACTIALRPA